MGSEGSEAEGEDPGAGEARGDGVGATGKLVAWAARTLAGIVGEHVEHDLLAFIVHTAVSAEGEEAEAEVDSFFNAWTERVHQVGAGAFSRCRLPHAVAMHART